jgi:hypothetical protein
MLFNPRYGTAGLMGMPCFLFEFIEPVLEILSYIAFAAALLLGVLNLELAIGFFLAAVGLAPCYRRLRSFWRRYDASSGTPMARPH